MNKTPTLPSRKWLLPIATIADVVKRVENMRGGEAVRWLAEQVEEDHLAASLYWPPTEAGSSGQDMHGSAARVQWRAISDRCILRNVEEYDYPLSVNDYYVLADDLLQFANTSILRVELSKALRGLAVGAKPSLEAAPTRGNSGPAAAQPAQPTQHATPATNATAEPQRADNLRRELQEIIAVSPADATAETAQQTKAPTETPARKQPTPTIGGEWKERARELAHEFIKRQASRDLFPSQVDISDEVARAMRNEGTHGDDGKPLSGSTIKRHALKGISSAQDKSLSMTMKRGK